MQQRESQAKAYQILPLYHQPLFSSMPNTKVSLLEFDHGIDMMCVFCQESVCGVLSLANPPQYMTVSKVKELRLHRYTIIYIAVMLLHIVT